MTTRAHTSSFERLENRSLFAATTSLNVALNESNVSVTVMNARGDVVASKTSAGNSVRFDNLAAGQYRVVSTSDASVKIPVLEYHGVIEDRKQAITDLDVYADDLHAQMNWLKTHGYKSITLKQYSEWRAGKAMNLPAKPVMFIYDDGCQTTQTAAGIMKQYGFAGISAVIPSRVGLTSEGYMTWDQINALRKNFGWEVASHTYSHSDIGIGVKPRVHNSQSMLNKETRLAYNEILEHTGVAPLAFVHPFNDATIRSRATAAMYSPLVFGKDRILCGDTNFIGQASDVTGLTRIRIQASTLLENFENLENSATQQMVTLTAGKAMNVSMTLTDQQPHAFDYASAYVSCSQTLLIDGTDGRDVITVDQAGKSIKVTRNGIVSDYVAANVQGIEVHAGADSDSVIISGNIESEIWGGTGNDRLIGGSNSDTIYGEAGNDFLSGREGQDVLVGNKGNDVFCCCDSIADSIDGGVGTDSTRSFDAIDQFVSVESK